MPQIINSNFKKYQSDLSNCIDNFDDMGILFGDGKRNKIKLFELHGKTINIKSFKIPNLINKVAYKYFRNSNGVNTVPDITDNFKQAVIHIFQSLHQLAGFIGRGHFNL